MSAVIKKAVEALGSQAALARACGVSQPAVFRWLNGRRVKADYVMAIVNATGGRVKTFMRMASELGCSDTHIGKQLQKAEGMVEGMLMALDITLEMDPCVQR